MKRSQSRAGIYRQEKHQGNTQFLRIVPKPHPSARSNRQTASRSSFPIVGVGASAGGLEAFTRLLKEVPPGTGMAFVLVQHLDPQHESALAELLARATFMPVLEVTNNQRVEPDHVYVIPPNTSLGILRGRLKLQPRQPWQTRARSIDAFLESLAQHHRERSIGVILSGTASDGTIGLEAVKAEGGITFAQDDSAKYVSMPRSAIAAGCVDFVLGPEDIAHELTRIARHPYVAGPSPSASGAEDDRAAAMLHEVDDTPLPSGGHGTPRTGGRTARREAQAAPAKLAESGFKKILFLLRNHCGVDFSLYKSSTIQRRIQRRVVLTKQDSIKDYAAFLRGNAKELDALYSDVLISVTSFFRNPEAFDVLQHKIFPKLLQKRAQEPVRVWVLGCSTGQEAYSIAMAFAEAAENASRPRKLQVFATDLNDGLLDKARQGLYAKSLADDVSPERLRRFFVEEQAGYRIIKPLREMVVFARQNLITDPPFSRMDLISCRNLLIYLEPGLQKKLMPTFHYALRPEGFLFMGASESVAGFTNLFEPADNKHKIFSRKAAPAVALDLPIKKGREQHPAGRKVRPSSGPKQAVSREDFHGELNAQREADRVTVNRFAPPGVLINAELQILQFRGPTSAYLQPPPAGKASFDVLKMAKEGLMLPLRAAINKAKREHKTVFKKNVPVERNGNSLEVNLEVIPLKNLREHCYLILFHDARKQALRRAAAETEKPQKEAHSLASLPSAKTASHRLASLQNELAEARDYLQSIQEQHEATNEELQASNEEIQSANEELQSINEELETSKEELESSNEELTTLNDEMASRNAELHLLNADLSNLQASTKLPILLLGRDLTIRRFSAPAEKIFDLVSADLGRPLRGIRHHLVVPGSGSPPLPMAGPARTAESVGPASPGLAKEGRPLRQSLTWSPFPLEALVREVIDTLREEEREALDRDGRWYSVRARPYLTEDKKIDGAVLVLVDITELKHVEHDVEVARDYANAIIRTARDPLVVLDRDLRVESVNDAVYRNFLVTPGDFTNHLLYDSPGGEWKIPKLRELLKDVLAQNSFFNDFEVTHHFPEIGTRTMLLNARRLDDRSGASRKILLGIEDVTDEKRIAAALRESEERYRALFDLGPVAVYSIDPSGVIQNFNRRAAELWGRKPAPGDTDQRFCGSFKMYRPDGKLMPHDQCPMAEVVTGRMASVHDEEVIIERPDGSKVSVVVNIRPLRNERGETIGAINCFYDITQRKQAELARTLLNDELATELAGSQCLQEASTLLIQGGDPEALYQQILGAAIGIMRSDMASLQMLDKERGVLLLLAWRGFHPQSARFWETVRADSGSSCAEALREKARIIVPDIEACKSLAGAPDIKEYRRSKIRAVQSTPLLSRSGQLIGMISTHWHKPYEPGERELRLVDVLARQAADLIERNQTEGARTRLASIVEFSDDAIISKDLNAVITSWNKGAERLFGYTAQEAIGQPVTMLIPPERVDEEPMILKRIRRGTAIEHYETVRRHKNGTLLNISLTVSPIRNSGGQVVGASKIARDITSRKTAEQSLRESQALLADRAVQLEQLVAERTARLQETINELEHFSYTITHDMRAPLRAMQGYGNLLLEHHPEHVEPGSTDLLRRIVDAANRMDSLIRDSLQYAKAVREKPPLEPVESTGVLRGVLDSYPSLQPPQVEIEVVEPLPPVIANEAGLAQCFSNLLTNAIKFVKPGQVPRVRIWAELRPADNAALPSSPPSTINHHLSTNSVRFWFEDNGIGIPPEYHDRIFQMFQQLDKSYEGTGIGLALVRKTAERMEGKVGVESALGKGSRFWLELRVANSTIQKSASA